jgi:leader peptidase (prepilin peptidase)/N-methyltransferase
MSQLTVLVPLIYVMAIAIPMAVIDFKQHRLPNRFTMSAIAVTISFLFLSSFLTGQWPQFAAAATYSVGTLLIGWWLAAKERIGMGDVKLLMSLNAISGYLSPLLPLVGMTLGFLGATLVSGIRILIGKISPSSAIALGPYLLAGFFVSVLPAAISTTAEVLS